MATAQAERHEFKAEIQQVLDILIHSLYTEREIFLRELVSNASDALNRFRFENLTNQNVHDPNAELAIWLEADKERNILRIRDTGIGMTQEEMVQNLGTIAHSGAKNFIRAVKESGTQGEVAGDVIGQFGVGFYALFMVADEVTVTSRSYQPDAEAAVWTSRGQGSYEVGAAEKAERGTVIEIKLKEDAKEFAETYRLRNIVKTHSDFIPFPIYLKEKEGDEEKWERINQGTALWRKSAKDVGADEYKGFYNGLTFDYAEPLHTLHFTADMPIQFYALLFVPSRRDYKMLKGEDHGLKLYARKILIQENFKELLPPYLRFIEGVVDSEDIPLNVSREAVQATPVIQKIRGALVRRLVGDLKKLAEETPDKYRTFYREFGAYLKEGVGSDFDSRDKLVDLLRFPSSRSQNADDWVSLEDYALRMKEDQKEIYYLIADDYGVAARSAHLDYFRKHDLEVLLLTDPMDNFMLMGLSNYKDKPLKNIDDADIDLPQDETEHKEEALEGDLFKSLVTRVKTTLKGRIEDVRESKVLSDSPARLVNPAGVSTNMQRLQRFMGQEVTVPRKILELNPRSALIQNLSGRLERDPQDSMIDALIEQLYENELLMEGIHPNPAEMIPRLQKLMNEASK